jgi:riboflavin synthase
MFSGIITTTASVYSFEKNECGSVLTLQISEDLLRDLDIGASVSVSGVCLTVTKIESNLISFDLTKETLDLTTLGLLKQGDKVNIERSFKVGDEIGGHVVSGHIHGMATLIEKKENGEYRFRLPENLKKFVVEKGFIALNGASLTVVDFDKNEGEFSVAFIPETLKITTFGTLDIGSKVNVEVDQNTRTIVETVERVLEEKGNA